MPFIIVLIPLINFCSTQPALPSNHHPGEVLVSFPQKQRWWWKTWSEWDHRNCSWLFCSKAVAPALGLDKSCSFSAAVSWRAWIQSGWNSSVQPNSFVQKLENSRSRAEGPPFQSQCASGSSEGWNSSARLLRGGSVFVQCCSVYNTCETALGQCVPMGSYLDTTLRDLWGSSWAKSRENKACSGFMP